MASRKTSASVGIRRTGPKRVLKSVEKMMLHLTAYQTKNLESLVASAIEPLMEALDEFARRMEKMEKRILWATRPGRRGPGRPPKKRGPGRPPKKRGPGRPKGSKNKRGPGRPPKKRGPGRPKGSKNKPRDPNSPKRGPGRPRKNPLPAPAAATT